MTINSFHAPIICLSGLNQNLRSIIARNIGVLQSRVAEFIKKPFLKKKIIEYRKKLRVYDRPVVMLHDAFFYAKA